MANMISAYFSRACDSKEIFEPCKISEVEGADKYRNQYPVIHISFNDTVGDCASYRQYIERIEKRLVKELKREYPQVQSDESYAVDVLMDKFADMMEKVDHTPRGNPTDKG